MAPVLVAATLWGPGTQAVAEPTAEPETAAALREAKSTGTPVILPSRTTETSVTAVTPQGRLSTEITTGPARVRDGNGTWKDIDTRLIESGGSLRPIAATADVRFSTGGSGPFAQLSRPDGKSLALSWPAPLPRPVIDGNKVVYRGVVASTGDLVATALPTGLRFDVVLRARPTRSVELRIAVVAKGLALRAGGGRIRATDGSTLVATSSAPAMWDAHRDAGTADSTSAIRSRRTGDITGNIENSGENTVLVLKPAMSFLNDPATVYPVTVDPSVVLPLAGDTDVNSAFDGNNVSGEYLKAGTESDGEKARAYLKFDTRGLQAPTKAELRLTNIDAPRCGPAVGAGIQVRRVTDFWAPDTQTWTPQPANTTEDAALSTEGSLFGSCGSERMTWDITAIVAKWAAGTAGNHGLVLQSPTETATANYRVFTSAENTEGLGDPPTLTVTTDIPFTPGEGDDPADPGPAPADLWPGRVEPETGVGVTTGTDLREDGLITTRSHSAGQRIDVTQPNENVLGPNWRLEPLGGMLGDRLKDFSANGYVQINLTSGTDSNRYLADPATPGRFVAEDGSTVVKNPDGTFTEHSSAETGTTRTWTAAGDDYLVSGVRDADGGTTVVTYDAQGRVRVIASPTVPQDACVPPGSPACGTATFNYATTTTATRTQFGDVAGQLKDISYDPAGDPAPTTVVGYAYDAAARLRQVKDLRQVDGEPISTSSYSYDAAGNITQLTTPADGTWNLTYSAPGRMTGASKAATLMALPAHCKYASQYLWGTDGCWAGPVPMEYGGPKLQPRWKRTPGNKAVVGVNNDNCTSPTGSRPSGFDFRVACDMHDYGYGIIYLKTREWDKSKKSAVDSVFYTTLRDYTCNAYSNAYIPRVTWTRRSLCRDWAWKYYQGVKYGGGHSMLYKDQY
ncbi:phospholipase A2 [Amycolatopsis sp. NPDC051128]|uniref:phospholipase A2 n=1 Tax=Amycolatopsis sp. NPDC051128 TaxID=3155412 RepID=UPI00343667E5